jgi:DNA polymerase-3 subunit gamma/tau
MKYQALYRKYRPLTFDDVFGQDAIVRTLKNSIINGKFSHAYLFCGPRGTGKTSIAKLLAKTVNCENNENGNPCGRCFYCKQIDNKATPDIVEIDAASNNGVDEIREIRNKVNLVPSDCKYKVYIIDEVHMLSIGAFNALLKTLEDPPAHVIFILATTEVHKVPSTIISRCQRFDFKKIEQRKIEEKIEKIIKEENVEIDEFAIKEIARLSDGGLRDAESLLDKLLSFSSGKIIESDVHMVNGTLSNSQLFDLLDNLSKNNIEKIVDSVNAFYDDGKDLIRLVEDMINFLRDILIYMLLPNYPSINDNFKKNYLEKNIKIRKEEIYDLIKNLNIANNEMRVSNNQKILLELALLSYCFDNKENKPISKEEDISEKKSKNPPEVKMKRDMVDKSKLKNLKEVRINNTLVTANKNTLNELTKRWNEIRAYTIDELYGMYAGMLIDSMPRAIGDDNILVTYIYESMVERANENLEKIEELLYKVLGKKYKFIATSENEWQNIKVEYIKRKKIGEKYIIIPEEVFVDSKIEKSKKSKKNEDEIIKTAIDLFGDNVIEVK